MNKLIVIAEKEEFSLLDKLGIGGIPVLVTGVGPTNVIHALKDVPKDTEIINVGYAGSKNLEPGKFYQVVFSLLYHPNVEYDEPAYKCDIDTSDLTFGELGVADCYTGCDFVLNSDLKNCLFDMELAYIHSLGFENVSSYKYVSDNLDLQEYRKTLNERK